ncbi:MAG: hypothetical protein EXR02_00275 [Rhodospirillales bacterium]|nr:hypothetical protein [Rhodospirillales bacterium]MSP79494.1 hypothetical protein [Rhodospirillales bacterium]
MSPAAFVVHDLGQAKAALKAARERKRRVCLIGAPGAAAALGPAVWRELVAEAVRAEPDALESAILDCGRDPGVALAALREGVQTVMLDVADEVRAKIEDIAGQHGAKVLCARRAQVRGALDLGVADPLSSARAWLNHG